MSPFFARKQFLWSFYGFIESTAEDMTETGGERGCVTGSKGTRARSRTQVCCRPLAHGAHTLPTELNGTPESNF